MGFIVLSFIAGVLTVLAPCVFPLLPVIIGGSVQDEDKKRPYVIIVSLIFFVVLFTAVLQFGEGILSISPVVLQTFSGGILIGFGIVMLFPKIWDTISFRLQLSTRSDKALHKASEKRSVWGSILTGGVLGPVFTSCSPTYLAIIGLSYQETDQFLTLLYLIAYVAGLGAILLLIALGGKSIVKRLKWASNPNGIFKKSIGVIFIVVGIIVLFEFQKDIQDLLLEWDFYSNLYQFEQDIISDTL